MERSYILDCRNNDSDLLELIRRNDDDAFSLLYAKYRGPLLNFAARYLQDKDSCEEIVQELFVGLHAKQIPSRIKTRISSYLFTALRNKILNYLRNQAVYKKHLDAIAKRGAVFQNNVEQFIDMRQLQREIACSIERMPDKCREVYVLRNQSDFTIRKISKVLNRPVDTVEKQLRRATKFLQNQLRESELSFLSPRGLPREVTSV